MSLVVDEKMSEVIEATLFHKQPDQAHSRVSERVLENNGERKKETEILEQRQEKGRRCRERFLNRRRHRWPGNYVGLLPPSHHPNPDI